MCFAGKTETGHLAQPTSGQHLLMPGKGAVCELLNTASDIKTGFH